MPSTSLQLLAWSGAHRASMRDAAGLARSYPGLAPRAPASGVATSVDGRGHLGRRSREAMPTATTTATTAAVGETLTPASGDKGPWHLIFDSGFDGTSLDTSQWCTGFYCGPGVTRGDNTYEEQCYDPAQVVESGGSLNLTSVANQETCNGGWSRPYGSGMVMTYGKFTFTFGYMEARIWMPSGPKGIADWPAFWACGQNWPEDGEIDVVEGLGGQAGATFHNSAGQQGPTFAEGTFAGGWHTYGADWAPGSLSFYYDDHKVATYTSGITSQPMFLILNLALSTTVTSPSTVPATMKVAYVRVWQH